MLPVQSIIIILYCKFIHINRLHYVWFQNNPGRTLNIQTLRRRQSESMANRTRINSAQSITRRQATSTVAKFHHVLEPLSISRPIRSSSY